MSPTGMPSVMQTTRGTQAAAASMIASAAAAGGTKISAQSAPASRTASSTVFHTGKPSWTVPPLPGVTPPTTWVPYSLQRRAWNVPSLPGDPLDHHPRLPPDQHAHSWGQAPTLDIPRGEAARRRSRIDQSQG